MWVAGHTGMVGSALVRRLESENCEILTVNRRDLDLRRQADVDAWMARNRPEVVFLAAATVGGIQANASRPGEFLYDNLAIASNVLNAAHLTGVAKLMVLGAACVYPRLAPQPMREDSLLEGPPEPTNEGYTIAKLAAIKMAQTYRRQYGCDFISVVPANLYGPGDRFDSEAGHVVAGLLMRAHKAKVDRQPKLGIWGSGAARREFLFVDDCADALVFLMKSYSDENLINVGSGEEVSIGTLARQVAGTVGYDGSLVFDTSKPDGMPRKLLDSTRMARMGWRAHTSLADGLSISYRWYLDQILGHSPVSSAVM